MAHVYIPFKTWIFFNTNIDTGQHNALNLDDDFELTVVYKFHAAFAVSLSLKL